MTKRHVLPHLWRHSATQGYREGGTCEHSGQQTLPPGRDAVGLLHVLKLVGSQQGFVRMQGVVPGDLDRGSSKAFRNMLVAWYQHYRYRY